MTVVTRIAGSDNKGFSRIVMRGLTGARTGRLDVMASWSLVVSTISPVMANTRSDMVVWFRPYWVNRIG